MAQVVQPEVGQPRVRSNATPCVRRFLQGLARSRTRKGRTASHPHAVAGAGAPARHSRAHARIGRSWCLGGGGPVVQVERIPSQRERFLLAPSGQGQELNGARLIAPKGSCWRRIDRVLRLARSRDRPRRRYSHGWAERSRRPSLCLAIERAGFAPRGTRPVFSPRCEDDRAA